MTRVKICGITGPEDALRAVDLGAWALGMIFWPDSPRACPRDEAEAIGAELHRRVELAGVFVNQSLDEIAQLADRCRLSLLQLHGDEGRGLLPRGRAPHRVQGDQVGARARRRPGAGPARLPDRLPPARRLLAERSGRHGPALRLGARAPPSGHAAGDPLRVG